MAPPSAVDVAPSNGHVAPSNGNGHLEPFTPPSVGEDGSPTPSSIRLQKEPLQLTGAIKDAEYFDVTPCLGREYRNVDLAEWLRAPNSDELLRDLAITISQRGVVFFRKQDGIGDEEQKELIQRLGELSGKPATSGLHIHPIYPVSEEAKAVKGNDEKISVISSKFKEKSSKVYSDAKSKAGGADKRGDKVYGDTRQSTKKQSMKTEWHSDLAFEHVPSDYTILRLTEVPETGGDTLWASGYELYDRLSPPYQKFMETLSATYHYAGVDVFNSVAEQHGFKLYTGARGAPENVGSPTAVHPVVRTNPVTGWKSLYGIGHHLKEINGVTKAEGKNIEDWFLRLVTENHDLQLRHRWHNANDVAIWDNRSMYHAATPDFIGMNHGHRTGHRAVSVGEWPYLDPNSWSRREYLGHMASKGLIDHRGFA